MRLPVLLAWVVLLSASPLCAQTAQAPCDDSLDHLLSILVDWSQESDSSLDYGFVAVATGAGLAVAYDEAAGFRVEPRQKLLWPGNLFGSLDSTYTIHRPRSWSEAESLLVQPASSDGRQLIYGPEAVVVTGVDTSLGAPWFFVSLCSSGTATAMIWDRADLRGRWWRWADLPGANSIWPLPAPDKIKLGRQVVYAGMRNLVLAARPDSLGMQRFGLAAVANAVLHPDVPPGSVSELRRLSGLRAASAAFIGRMVDLWPPAKREPVRLAAFYLQKDAEAWQTLAAVSGTWDSYDSGQRAEWLATLAEWETKAAVALDQMISSSK